MPRKIQQREADAIAAKLQADIKEKTRHSVASIRIDGTLVGSFGIRRGRNTGHDYIPEQIHLNQSHTLQLAACTFSRDDYIAHLRTIGHLPAQKPQPSSQIAKPAPAPQKRHDK